MLGGGDSVKAKNSTFEICKLSLASEAEVFFYRTGMLKRKLKKKVVFQLYWGCEKILAHDTVEVAFPSQSI